MPVGNALRTIAWEWAHVPTHRWRTLTDRTHPAALASGTGAPVVMLPGVYESWRYLLPLARRLHAAGHPVVVVPRLGYNRRGLTESADVVAEAIEAADVTRAVLVGHSKGGLIGKRLLLSERVGWRLAGLVALCTPWEGVPWAGPALRCTAIGLFAPGGAELTALASETAVDPRITAIQPAWDQFIGVPVAPVGARVVRLGVSGHLRPLLEPAVQELTVAEVARLAGTARR